MIRIGMTVRIVSWVMCGLVMLVACTPDTPPQATPTPTTAPTMAPTTASIEDTQAAGETPTTEPTPTTIPTREPAEDLPEKVVGPTPTPVPTRVPEETTIRLARARWKTGWFQAAIYQELLEKMGYRVEGPDTTDVETFYTAVRERTVDLWPNGWFPLHNTYLDSDKGQEKIEAVGSELRGGALQGYLIDKKTADAHTITNLADLQDPDLARLFDSDGDGKANLIGCDNDWPCHEVIEYHLDAYDLSATVEQTSGRSGTYENRMQQVVERFEAGKPVLFYTWTPNWTVGELEPGEEVVWIEVPFTSLPERQRNYRTQLEGVRGCVNDPCNLGFPPNDIRVVANSAFLNENPRVRRLLEQVEIPPGDIARQNLRMFQGEDSEEDIARHAREWIEENEDLVRVWVDDTQEFIGGGMLQRVKARAYLRCGVDEGFTGFSVYNEETQAYEGFNADFCRAIGAAIFGDPQAVEFVPLEFPDGFQALADRDVDVLLNNTTWTAVRDAGMDPPNSGIKLRFGPTIFHDGQRIMVRKADAITTIDDITVENVRLICVQEGTTSQQNIEDLYGSERIVPTSNEDRVYRMYEDGICDAVTADTTELTSRKEELANPDDHIILDTPISREPLGVVVIEGDEEWADVVNWAIFATMYAEELGVNSGNCEELRNTSPNPDVKRLLGVEGEIGERLGLDNSFAYNIICKVGHYGEIYERNLLGDGMLNIERGPNKIWRDGGVLSSPPFR